MKTKFTPILHPKRCRIAFQREMAFFMRYGLFAGLVAIGPFLAHAQLSYDPNNTGGTALGGSGGWYSYYWDGTNDVGWDGFSPTIYSGTPGTVTLEAEVDCGGTNAANANLTFNSNYTFDLNGEVFNYQGQYGLAGFHIASGASARIIGEPADIRGEFLDWGDGGKLILGDGRAITNASLAGVGDLRGGVVEINNDLTGKGAFGWYVNNGSSTIIGTGNVSDALVQLTGAGASISPGPLNGTGTLLINASLEEINNHTLLSFNLGGLNQGAVTNGYSWLNVNGTVTLDLQYIPASSIGLKLVNGYIPALGNFFDVITCSNFVFTAGTGGSGLADLTYNLPILPGLAWSESIITNGSLQSLRFTVVSGPLLTTPPDPLAYLNFNNNLTDQTGNGHNGVFVSPNAAYSLNVPNTTAGAASLAVPGDNSTAVSLTNTTGISEDDAQSFTISLWFRISNSSDYPSFVKCSNPDTNAPINYYGFLGVNPSGKLTYGVFNIFNLSSVSFVADGNWHQAVVVHDGTAYSYQLYVDSVPDGFAYQTGTDQGANLWDVTIGNAFLAAGNVDEVAYWNQKLTAAQVATVYYLGPVPGAPTLSISPSAGNVSLSWLLGGYTLQQNASLTSPGSWTDLGTNSPVILPIGTGSEFFRLKE
jgi:hypothetical protein